MKKENIFSVDNTSILDIQCQGAITVANIKHNSIKADLISIHKAIENNLVIVKEIDGEESVNHIEVINKSNSLILILDGDILKGAKQNRVSNTSILIDAKQKVIIPVSCVEQGRWRYNSNKFSSSSEIAHKKIREQKNRDIYSAKLIHNSTFEANQSNVWNSVSHCSMDLCSSSPTSSHSDAFESNRKKFIKMTDSLKPNNDANGLAYFIDGKLMGVEIFNNNQIYSDYYDKMKMAIAMEAEIKSKKSSTNQSVNNYDAFEAICLASNNYNNNLDRVIKSKGVCLGEEHRLITDVDNLSRNYYDLTYNTSTIHQSILISQDDDGQDGEETKDVNIPTDRKKWHLFG